MTHDRSVFPERNMNGSGTVSIGNRKRTNQKTIRTKNPNRQWAIILTGGILAERRKKG